MQYTLNISKTICNQAGISLIQKHLILYSKQKLQNLYQERMNKKYLYT